MPVFGWPPVVSETARPVPPAAAGVAHIILVALHEHPEQETALHDDPPIVTELPVAEGPKFEPEIVIRVLPLVGPLFGVRVEIDGGEKLNK